MNKILLSIAALSLSFSAASQLRVLSNGHTQIGDWTNFSTSNRMSPDTTSTLAIMGPDNLCSGGSIAFGARNDVTISESVLTAPPVLSHSERSSMILRGMGGISYRSKKGIVFKYEVNTPLFGSEEPVETMIYYVDVKAPQFLTSSDSRFKKNIEGIEDSDKLLLDLTPVSYYLSIPRETEGEEVAKASVKNEEINNK